MIEYYLFEKNFILSKALSELFKITQTFQLPIYGRFIEIFPQYEVFSQYIQKIFPSFF